MQPPTPSAARRYSLFEYFYFAYKKRFYRLSNPQSIAVRTLSTTTRGGGKTQMEHVLKLTDVCWRFQSWKFTFVRFVTNASPDVSLFRSVERSEMFFAGDSRCTAADIAHDFRTESRGFLQKRLSEPLCVYARRRVSAALRRGERGWSLAATDVTFPPRTVTWRFWNGRVGHEICQIHRAVR